MPIVVSNLDRKLMLVIKDLRMRTRDQLADRLNITASNFPKWIKGEIKGDKPPEPNTVPDHHIAQLAKLVGATEKIFVEYSGAEFEKWLEQRSATSAIWDQALARGQPGYVNIVRVDPPGDGWGVGPNREVVLENENFPLAPEGAEVFRINDRIYLDLTIPSPYFRKREKLYALVLLTHKDGTKFITSVMRPLRLITKQLKAHWPEDAPHNRFALRNPPGEHQFTAVFLDSPLQDYNKALAEELDAAKLLNNGQLNALGGQLLSMESYSWLVSKKEFFVTPV